MWKTILLWIVMVSSLSMVCAEPSLAGVRQFSGNWSVKWCDPSDMQADCGGFSVTLIQRGDRLCGSYDGARVRLAQIDEGDARAIRGVVVGKVAVMTIESARSGNIYLVRAAMNAGVLHWRVVDTIRESNGDIDIVALNDKLTRAAHSDQSERSRQIADECGQLFGIAK